MAPSWGDVIRVVVIDGVGVARGLGAGLDGTTISRGVCGATGCSGPTGGRAVPGHAAPRCRNMISHRRCWRGRRNVEVSGSVATCTDSGGISVGAGSGETASVGVGSADSVDTSGDETVVAGCWTVSTPEPARRLRVNGTRPRGPAFRDYPVGDGEQAQLYPRRRGCWRRLSRRTTSVGWSFWGYTP